MESEELKPCPFCGGIGKVYAKKKDDIGLTIWCECEKCHAKTQGYCPNGEHEECALDNIEYSKNKAINLWNGRAGNEEMVEKLRNTSFERYGNDGMGGEQVVNLDDAIEIVREGRRTT